ncbi:MAG: hypothetical protein NTZ73_02510 [Candidatus Diapherotrites archaeon]|nr:hypothetical protein [Candidatus Diapherotrites archaeon]
MGNSVFRISAFFAVLLLLIFPAFAFEKTFSELGYPGLNVETVRSTNCSTINFSVPQETLNSDLFPIFSLKMEYYPMLGGDSRITIKLDNSREIKILPMDFSCDEECWARVSVPKEEMGAENSAEICAISGKSTSELVLLSESKIGFYDTPVFSLRKESPGTILLGQKAKLKIIATNSGSKDANVFVQFISPLTREAIEITSFDVVEGESSARTVIKSGETREFVFYIKPTLASGYNLPAAVLFFENVFGEEQKVVSNHPQLEVIEPKDVKVVIVASKPEGKSFSFLVEVKNNRMVPFQGLLKISNQELVEGAISPISVPPNSDKQFSFVAKNLSVGDYSIFATVEDENASYNSNTVAFAISGGGLPIEVYFAIFGLIVSAVLLWYIYRYWKENY